ncbi:MAG: oligosaccharide flippase family protein [Candidatus Pacearchaeota archaeon]|nr:oligosaccharide flippase family protein [Candidatus Pacearchaeota archaeon]
MKINKSLWKGSIVLLIAFGIFNFFHFLFQFFMARMLTVIEYGILATLFAITYILLVFTESFQTVLAKYSARERDLGKLKNVFKRSSKKALKFSIMLFIAYLIVGIFLSKILNIKYLLISTTGLVIFLAFFLPISRGIMQGRKKFKALGANMIFEATLKLIIGFLLVFLGWSVFGAIVGVILGGFAAFLFSFLQLKEITRAKEKIVNIGNIYKYAMPTIIVTASIVVFYSLDVVIARIFFEPEIAGAYAIASILGKVIFWGTLPISKAMFPLSSSKGVQKEKSGNIFANSLVLVFMGIISALIVFYFFPEFVIKIFSGKSIPDAVSVLFYLGIAFSFISLSNIILLHKLSIDKIKRPYLLGIFIILEIVLLSVFSSNLIEFSIAFVTASAAFLWGVVFLIRD